MSRPNGPIILASRSPRRRELLALLVPAERIEILPPSNSDEAGFDGLETVNEITKRLKEIAAAKCDDVLKQLRDRAGIAAVISADTTIIATDRNGAPVVLGQAPEENWQDTVRQWFRDYYFGRVHLAATAFCIAVPNGPRIERVVQTSVTFDRDGERWLDWYLSTGEPRGKAGGYGIQGAGSVFASRVEGSPSNVIGLPLREVLDAMSALGLV